MDVISGESIRRRLRIKRCIAMITAALLWAVSGEAAMVQTSKIIPLPPPAVNGTHSLERLLEQRRSVREFASAPLTLAQLGQLLWAAQGITSREGLRTAPSAGALYPLELYVAVGEVKELAPGIYRYEPRGHSLSLVDGRDRRRALAAAALNQDWIAAAPVVFVFGAVYSRTESKYGDRAGRYVPIEVGHAAENLFLQAGDLGLGTCDVGAFDDGAVARAAYLPREVTPLLLMPAGRPR